MALGDGVYLGSFFLGNLVVQTLVRHDDRTANEHEVELAALGPLVGAVILATIQSLSQFSQRVHGIPVYTTAKTPADSSHVTDGLAKLDAVNLRALLESDPTLKEHARATSDTNRRDLLDKVVSMIQGVLLAEALPALAGDAGAALLSAQTVILLASLFANMTEAEERQRALDSGSLEPGRFNAAISVVPDSIVPTSAHIPVS